MSKAGAVFNKIKEYSNAVVHLPSNLGAVRRLLKQRRNSKNRIKEFENFLDFPLATRARNLEKVKLNVVNKALIDFENQVGKGTAGVAAGVGTAGLTIRGFKELKRREVNNE